jgi:hypothetical protein
MRNHDAITRGGALVVATLALVVALGGIAAFAGDDTDHAPAAPAAPGSATPDAAPDAKPDAPSATMDGPGCPSDKPGGCCTACQFRERMVREGKAKTAGDCPCQRAKAAAKDS